MSTNTQQVVSKAGKFADVLRDDGLSYMAYVEQITFLHFLKMADEQTKPPYNRKPIVPAGYDWASLLAKEGDALETQYRHILRVGAGTDNSFVERAWLFCRILMLGERVDVMVLLG